MKLTKEQAERLAELKARKEKGERLSPEEFAEFKKLGGKVVKPKESGKIPIGNDFAWWNKVQELMKDAANLKANWLPGTRLDSLDLACGIAGVVGYDLFDNYVSQRTEGSASDPINLAARDIFLKMFRKYRGITLYQAADLGIVMTATIEILAEVAMYEKVYGVINRYDKLNQNMPYSELEAMGISSILADAIRASLSDFRYSLNLLIRKAQRLCVPKDMSVIADKLSLYGLEYLDHDNKKGQIIIFNKRYFGTFDETSMPTGSSLKFSEYNMGTRITPTGPDYFPILKAAIDALVGSDSVQKIYGDLLAWFGEDQLITLLPLPEDYVVYPVYSESILHKVHNADILGDPENRELGFNTWVPSGTSTNIRNVIGGTGGHNYYWIYQNNNIIHGELSCRSAGDVSPAWASISGLGYVWLDGIRTMPAGISQQTSRVLDSYHQDFTDEVVCEGGLWKCLLKEFLNGSTNKCWQVKQAGPEIFIRAKVIVQVSAGSRSTFAFNNHIIYNASSIDTNVLYGTVFDWMPIIYAHIASGGATQVVAGDIDNARAVTRDELSRITDAAMYSMFTSDIQVLENAKH